MTPAATATFSDSTALAMGTCTVPAASFTPRASQPRVSPLSSGGFDADETKEPTAPAPKAAEPKAKQVIARKPATVVEEDDEAPSPARKEVPLQKAEPKRPVPAEQADDDSDDMGSEDIDALLKQLDD